MDKLAKTMEPHPVLIYFPTLSADAARLNLTFSKTRGKYGEFNECGLAEGLPTKLVTIQIPPLFYSL
jgi:hypothetical protein